jgi:hypothetical protein
MAMSTRRKFLSWSAAVLAAPRARGSASRPAADEAFLEDLSRRGFSYFWDQADPKTGLTLDRTRNSGARTAGRSEEVASLAATGFGLTAMAIGYARGWRPGDEIRERVRAALRHLAYTQPHERGWYYHFVERHSGERVWKSELSTIDTALLLAGVLTAQQCFAADAEIVRMAQEIYERVDFPWMLEGSTNCLRMGWSPERGFLRAVWGEYRENLLLYLLGIGSPAHPIPISSWYAFKRDPVVFEEYRFVGAGPIFTHQFSHAWLDLEGLRDGPPFAIDYFRNSVIATLAHREFCLSLRGLFPGYNENIWGVTPSDSEIGYLSWGGFSRRDLDGTVAPCAAAGSLMFTPELSLVALRAMRDRFATEIYGRYGFSDAFHPLSRWVNPDVVGIDLGITLLSAENLRTRAVWNWFKLQPNVRRAMGWIFESQPDAGRNGV